MSLFSSFARPEQPDGLASAMLRNFARLRHAHPVWHGMLQYGGAALLVLLGLGIAYKVKRMLQINVFPNIDMVPDEQLKAAVLWVVHLVF